jgi:hypothetical protein
VLGRTGAPGCPQGARRAVPAAAVSRQARDRALLTAPLLGAALLALASRDDVVYRFLVREDSVLEWAQVAAYTAAAALGLVGAPLLWRRGDKVAGATLAVLGLAAFLSAGEEISWGQRLLGFGTPELFAENEQGEVTLHNDARVANASRVVLLLAGVYGLLAPIAYRHPTPLVPPRRLIAFFAVVTAYFAFRLLFLPAPGYVQAKYSEWPELCLALAVAWWCWGIVAQRTRDAPDARAPAPGR